MSDETDAKNVETHKLPDHEKQLSKDKPLKNGSSYQLVEKKCSKCKGKFPIKEFSIAKKNPDGRKYTCKKCDRQTYIEYRKKKTAAREAPGIDADNITSMPAEIGHSHGSGKIDHAGLAGAMDDTKGFVIRRASSDKELSRQNEKACIRNMPMENSEASQMDASFGNNQSLEMIMWKILQKIKKNVNTDAVLRDDPMFLIINFSNFPHLYEYLMEHCRDEYRSPEDQMLYWIQLKLKNDQVDELSQ